MDVVVSIVAGGWSFSGVDHRKVPGVVIGVNDTLLHFTSRLSYIVSMDRLWAEQRWHSLEARCIDTYLRRGSLRNVDLGNGRHETKYREWLHTFECDRMFTTFGKTRSQLNGRNSGACALNLAYVLQPKELYLFGFDMCRSFSNKAYWYPGYDWVDKGDKGGTGQRTYDEWASDFKHYAEQFTAIGTKVWNVSLHSKIDVFEKLSAENIGCAL